MKKYIIGTVALLTVLVFAGVALAQDSVFPRKQHTWTEKQTFRAPVEQYSTSKYGEDAEITTSRRTLYPENLLENSLYAVWSGGTRYGVLDADGKSGGSKWAVPDGWNVQGAYTGVTRCDAPDAITGSGSSVYSGFPYSAEINCWGTATGAGTTRYYTYPATTGVSTSAAWFDRFRGKRVVFGAFVKRDLDQYTKTGVTTNFIRPFINTYSGAGYLAGETSFAFGDYQTTNGWAAVSATTTVPLNATALEVGFAMNPTVLAATSTSGDSAYVCAPFLYIDPLSKEYASRPGEVIFFKRPIDFDYDYDKSITAVSAYNVPGQTRGIAPAAMAAAYLVSMTGNAASGVSVMFRANAAMSGVSFPANRGASTDQSILYTTWVVPDADGNFELNSSSGVSNISITLHGVELK